MVDSAISALLGKLVSLLEEEVNFLRGVPDEVIRLRDELEFMKAFLLDADAAQRVDGERDKVWIKKVRDVAFDTEDILDEFLLYFPYRRRRRQQKRRWFRDLVQLVKKSKRLKAFHQLATKLQTFKARVDNISTVHLRYDGGLERGSSSAVNSISFPEPRSDRSHLPGEARLVGVDEPKKKLLSLLLKKKLGSKRAAVAVLGMGGMGKTTLADLVYNDEKVKQHFEHTAWITVTQSFKLGDLLRDVIEQLSVGNKELPVDPEEGYSSMGTNMLKETIRLLLCNKRYLIVLDDVWRVASWDDIQSAFPRNGRKSRLMLTTRNVDVASNSIQSCGGKIYSLRALSDNLSWKLFRRKAFPRSSCPVHLETICRNIVQQCDGLPLAIAAIGGMLAMKDRTSIDQFERVRRSLGAELVGNDSLNSVKKILSLSFDDLPSNLKSCLFYLTIFPKDGIVKNKLIRLWIAESFVLKQIGSRSSLEEVGEAYLNELLNRSLIQVSEKHDDGRIKACRIHDLIREIIMLKVNEEQFAMIANRETGGFSGRVRRLSVHKTVENIPEELEYFSKLRSLLLFQVEEFVSNFSISKFLKGSRLLQVLDCSHAPIDSFPKEITKLYNLRYLSLKGTKVKSIPCSIAKLRNLQTLNLKDTGVEELPVEILQLSRLRHIHAYRSVQHGPSDVFTEIKGFKALEGIDVLTSLQSLCHMEANEGSADILRSIVKLTQLRRLGILRLRKEDGADLCSAIDKLSHLVTLDLTSRDGNEILSLQNLVSIPQHLQRLYLAGRLGRLPHWIPRLLGLKSLVLRFSGLKDDPLQYLQQLSNLVELRFYRAYEGEELCFKAKCFPELKILDLRNLGKLKRVIVEGEAIPCVETLIFEDCKMLKGIPSGIETLNKLQQLELIDMGTELVESVHGIDNSNQKNYMVKISSRCGEDGANESTYQYMSNISTNIIQNHDFSEELNHWTANSCTGFVVAGNRPDSRYAVVSNRTQTSEGLEQDITGRISIDSVYSVSAFVAVSGPVEGSPEIKATLRIKYQEPDAEYVFVGRTSVSNESWKELTGTISLTTKPSSVILYFEGPSPGIEMRIRSVVITKFIIRNPRFEDGLNNWSGRGCEISESACMGYGGYITPFSGERFACTTNRTKVWNGIYQDITGRVKRKRAYEFTAIVRVFCSSNVTESEVIAALYVKRADNREDYIEFARVQATDSIWKKLQGKFLMIDDEPLSVVVYIEGPPPKVDILLDSLVIKHIEYGSTARPDIENPAFGVNIIKNSNLNGGSTVCWFCLGNCILSVAKGSPCELPPLAREALEPYNNREDILTDHYLLSTNRSEDWMGPAQMLTNRLKLFLTYQVSAWVKIGYGAKGPQKVSINLEVVNKGQEVMGKSLVRGGEVEIKANSDKWYEIAGSFRLEKQPATVMIYAFGPDPGIELMVAGLRVFPVDRVARFEHLKQQTDEIRKRNVVLEFSGENSSSSRITAVKVQQTKNSFPLGSCLYRSNLDNEGLKNFFRENFNCAVFADEMKWCHSEPKQGSFNYEDADKMLEFCQSNNIQVRGHCVLSEADNKDPQWISSLSKSKLSTAVKNRLKGFIGQYKGKVKDYTLINEMLSGSFYKDRLGEAERAKLFKQAKRLDPDARLFTNENNVDGGCHVESSPEKYIALVKDLNSKGATIGGIGIQGHNNCPIGPIIRSALDKLSVIKISDRLELKLPIWYTELEVSSGNEHVRADDLEVMIREAFAHPAVEGIVLWGFWELFMGENTENISHLVNAEGEVNEAGKRLLKLKQEFLTNAEGPVDEQRQFRFRGFPGTYTAEVVTASGTILSTTFDVQKGDADVEHKIDIRELGLNYSESF